MTALLHDFRYALRTLAKSPGFAAVSALTLALGVGVNTAMFSLLHAVLFRPLPGVQQPEQIVAVLRKGDLFGDCSYPNYLDYREQSQLLSGLVAFRSIPLNLGAGAEPERVSGSLVTGNYFSVLGVQPLLGRAFLPEEDLTPGAHPVAVISHRLWMRRFGSDRTLVGSTIKLNGRPFSVIGVAPPEFRETNLPESIDVWVPMTMQPQAMPANRGLLQNRDANWFSVLGRLKPGITRAQAEAELNAISRRLEQQYPAINKGLGVALFPAYGIVVQPAFRAGARNFLALLMAVVGAVLLIACGNVAGLLLARSAARRKEIAVRLALGASRWRLVRQLLAESMLLGLIGGAAGLLVARWASQLIKDLLPPDVTVEMQLDPVVLAFTLLLSLLTGVIFGLAPALAASRPHLAPALKDTGAATGQFRSRARRALVIAQVACSVVLLTGAGLFVRTLRKFQAVDTGLNPAGVLLASVDLDLQGYPESKGRQYYRDLLRTVAGLPGVASAGLARSVFPSTWIGSTEAIAEGRAPGSDGRGLPVAADIVSPRYFETAGIRLLRGRDFTDRDRPGAPRVAVINQTLARQLWPGEDPIGKRVLLGTMFRDPYEVIGVVQDVISPVAWRGSRPAVYRCIYQNYTGSAVLHARVAGPPLAFASALRQQVRALDPDLPLFGISAMTDQIASEFWEQRMSATLVGAFGLLALVLASVGLYGVMAHAVVQRTREMGIRVALGAGRADLLKLVLGESLLLVASGLIIGLAAAFPLARLISSRLYGITPADPASFAAAGFLLTVVALVASYVPARRASRVDPITALRHE